MPDFMSTYDNFRSGCYLGESASPNIINEEVIVASGQGKLRPGTILGKLAAGGKYVAHNPAGTGGAQTATAILFHAVDATDEDVLTVATVNGPAYISRPYLKFADAISDANKAAAIAALAAKDLKVSPDKG